MSTTIEQNQESKVWKIAKILFFIVVFFAALDLLTASLNFLGIATAQSFFQGADNPFIGLFIGLLATAIIQSSSTTTTATVALVATGAINYDTAIPIIMGANIGTTITPTLVSLAFIGQRKKFTRALATALSHNFFNVILVLILFPLEFYYGVLSSAAQWISSFFSDSLVITETTVTTDSTLSLSGTIIYWIDNGIIVLIVSFFLLFFSIKLLAKSIYELLVTNRNSNFDSLFDHHVKSFLFGSILTAGVQSSSITTSFAVPVAATGEISIKKIFPFIIGANLGTTITAFFATLMNSEVALVIAFAHLLFNVLGAALFLPFAALRNFPVHLAQRFGELTTKYWIVGFIYILFTFFILPFALIYLNRGI